QWALHYDPLFTDSLESLDSVPEAAQDATYHVRRASALLAVGRIEDARRDLVKAKGLDANNAAAHALNAIIDVALNDRTSALENGRRAVALNKDSSAAHLAL